LLASLGTWPPIQKQECQTSGGAPVPFRAMPRFQPGKAVLAAWRVQRTVLQSTHAASSLEAASRNSSWETGLAGCCSHTPSPASRWWGVLCCCTRGGSLQQLLHATADSYQACMSVCSSFSSLATAPLAHAYRSARRRPLAATCPPPQSPIRHFDDAGSCTGPTRVHGWVLQQGAGAQWHGWVLQQEAHLSLSSLTTRDTRYGSVCLSELLSSSPCRGRRGAAGWAPTNASRLDDSRSAASDAGSSTRWLGC
jgi:hypothetical protein